MSTPPDSKRHRATFIEDFVEADCSTERALQRLSGDGRWLEPMASRATDDADSLLVRVGPAALGSLGMEVRVQLGECSRRGVTGSVPIRWEAARLPYLFPVLDGDLEVTPLGPGSCRLTLHASYRTPLDGVGRLLDAALFHRVAESTVRSFLHRVADNLGTGEPKSGPEEAGQ